MLLSSCAWSGRARGPSPHDTRLQNLLYQFCKFGETCFHIAAEVQAQRPALAVGQNLEIAPSLCCLYYSESVLLSGNRQVLGIVACDLQEHAAVGAALISLSGGVQKTRPEAEARRHMFAVADGHAQGLQQRFVFRIHLDIAKEGKVVAGAKTRQMRAQITLKGGRLCGDGALPRTGGSETCLHTSNEVGGVLIVGEKLEARFFKYGFFGRKRAREFVFRGELFGYDFARFDVGLIEGVDPEDGACDRGRNFPAKELLPEIVDVGYGNAYDRVPGFFQRGDLGILHRVGGALQPEVGESSVITIYLGCAELFAVNRDDALAEFASGFRDQLLEPRAQVANSGRGDERNFVAAKFCRCANEKAEHHSRILFYRSGRLAGVDHFFCAREELAGVDAHRRGGNHAKV